MCSYVGRKFVIKILVSCILYLVCVWGGGGGGHTVEAYSNCGLTSVLYATDFRSLLWTRMFLFRKPRVLFALLVILSIWVLHDRSSEMVTPRYFADETISSMVSCRKYLVSMGSFKASDMKDLAFGGIKVHIRHQICFHFQG